MSRLLPVIAILVALGLFFGYINPTITGSIQQLQMQINDYENALAAAERFKEKEAELAAERALIPAESIVRLEAFLPDGVDNVQLILDLDALAARTGLVLSDFQTDETEPSAETSTNGIVMPTEDPLDSIQLSTSGKGTYSAFRAFLAATEESLRPLDLVALTVKTNENGVHTYDMTFRLYWLR